MKPGLLESARVDQSVDVGNKDEANGCLPAGVWLTSANSEASMITRGNWDQAVKERIILVRSFLQRDVYVNLLGVARRGRRSSRDSEGALLTIHPTGRPQEIRDHPQGESPLANLAVGSSKP